MYRAILCDCPYERNLPWIFPMCYLHAAMIILYPWIKYNTDCSLFSQVKNKPWLPCIYSWIRHRREHWEYLICLHFKDDICLILLLQYPVTVSCGVRRRPADGLRSQHVCTIRLLVWDTLENFFAILTTWQGRRQLPQIVMGRDQGWAHYTCAWNSMKWWMRTVILDLQDKLQQQDE